MQTKRKSLTFVADKHKRGFDISIQGISMLI